MGDDAYMLSVETRLGYSTIREIFEKGFSRIPVFGKDKNDYVGLLYTKDLMLADPEDEMRLGDFIKIFNRGVESFLEGMKLNAALHAFTKGGTHMGLVRRVNVEDSSAPCFEVAGLLTLEDIVEEILQEEIVDETDEFLHVERGVRVGDGREKAQLNLGVFDPVWKTRMEGSLSRDEIAAVAAHLRSAAFCPGSEAELSVTAVEYLVATSEVRTQKRVTPLGVDEPEDKDRLYANGEPTELCTLVLQGRVCVLAGRARFRSEAGAFSILAKDALTSKERYCPDFHAHLSTAEVRLILISRERFLQARTLDKDQEALQKAWQAVASISSRDSMRRPALALSSPSPSNSAESAEASAAGSRPTLLTAISGGRRFGDTPAKAVSQPVIRSGHLK